MSISHWGIFPGYTFTCENSWGNPTPVWQPYDWEAWLFFQED